MVTLGAPSIYERDLAANVRADDAMRLLWILPTMNPYGGVISVVNLANRLIMEGDSCTIVSLSNRPKVALMSLSEPIWLRDRGCAADVLPGPWDVVVATSWDTVTLVLEIAEANPGTRVAYFVQDIESRFFMEDDPRRQRAQDTYRRIQKRIVKTRYLQKQLEKMGFSAYRIRPGMDLELFCPRRRRSPAKPKRILAMARPASTLRGFDFLLEVAASTARTRDDVQFVFVGSDDVEKPSFPCEIYGRVDHERIPELMSDCDVFFDPSVIHGFGRPGVEAMACGLPAVLMESGGVGEYAVDEKNALVVKERTVKGAVAALGRILDDDELAARLRTEGLRTVREFDDGIAAREIREIFLAGSG